MDASPSSWQENSLLVQRQEECHLIFDLSTHNTCIITREVVPTIQHVFLVLRLSTLMYTRVL